MRTKLPEKDLARRRIAWAVLSELFLDTQLDAADHERIAAALTHARFDADVAERILRREVGPVLWPNLLSVAGEWEGFDLDAMEAKIRPRIDRRWPPLVSGFQMVRGDWRAVRACMDPAAGSVTR